MTKKGVIVFDANKLLLPISKKAPAGSDLRLDPAAQALYQQIKDARLAARTAERQQSQGAEGTTDQAQWQTVLALGQIILTERSKDLEVAAWMTEALLRERGFAGLKDGFCLLRELIEHFWESLYPSIDEDGLSTKIAPLIGLNGEETDGTLIVPIAMISLTAGRSSGPFALWQYQQALETNRISDKEKQAQRISQGAVTLEAIQTAVKETPPLFFHQLRENVIACKQEFLQLIAALDARCGDESSPGSRIRAQLDACLECIDMVAKEIVGVVTQQEKTEIIESKSTSHYSDSVPVMPTHVSGESVSREQVLQNLLQSADFFRRTEPHSPLSYVLERTVRWGRMSLPELLKELVRDEPSLGQIRNLTGVE
jgi:type VI secretion system protein ImpA